ITFSDHPALQMIPEWKKQYMSYEVSLGFCSVIHSLCFKLSEFFRSCEEELNKVNLFFSEKLSEAHNRLATLGIVAQEVSGSKVQGENCGISVVPPTKRRRTNLKQIKIAVGELYLSLAFLQKYQVLYIQLLDKTLNVILQTFMIQLEGGDKLRAMKRLEVPPMDKTPVRTKSLTCEIKLLAVNQQVTYPIVLKVLNETDLELLKPQLQLYKGTFLLIEFLFLIGLNLYCFNISAINHTLIFGLDPRDHLSYYHIFEMAGGLTVCWCTSVLASLHPSVLSVPQQLHPLLFHSFLLFLLLNPFSIFHTQARRWLISKVLAAPFQPVSFAECWLADQFNSLSPLFLGLRDLLCFYTYQINWRDMWSDNFLLSTVSLDCGLYSLPVTCLIQCFPPWLRFAQCLRCFWDTGHTLHLLNAGKYFTVFLMVTFASLYNMARGTHQMNGYKYFQQIRFIWNLFRLENEQLKNCEKCCAVRDFCNIWRHLEKDQDVLSKDHHKITTRATICCLPRPKHRLFSGQLLNLFHLSSFKKNCLIIQRT
uniref:SPX domain-containing protein n=1 Tax=Sinocyclocheilus anshuiensis TaxID=1608454 RepID=A0A671KH29_9TELE